MSEYERTPDTNEVREVFAVRRWDEFQLNYPNASDEAERDREGEAFDRWHAEELRKARAEAWDQGHSCGIAYQAGNHDPAMYTNPHRADAIDRADKEERDE